MVNTYGRLNPMCVCVFKKTCASVDEWEHVLSVSGGWCQYNTSSCRSLWNFP